MELSQKEKMYEENHLDRTLKIVRNKISELGQEFYDKEDKIQEFKELIWDSKHDMDPAEMRFMMAESDAEVLKMERKSKYFQTLFRIQGNPYFGKIIFRDNINEEEIYIGITHVEDDLEYYVHDWRSPICSLFYDYEVGKASYLSPDGLVSGDLKVKRQYKIEDGKLKGIFDTSINIEDDVLQQVLAEDSNDKMKNIVNTIQQEQNKVIRNTEDKTLIVQGIAGSGKTSVALHRIAFLLYKIKNLSSQNVLIFSPNQVFSEYISNVLPELGEDNTLQTTFNKFMESNINEYHHVEEFTKFIERFYKDKTINKELIKYKQSNQAATDIKNYIDNLRNEICFIDDLDTRDFTYTKDELNYFLHERYNHLKFYDIIPVIATKICDTHYNGKKTNHKKLVSELYKRLNKKINIKEIYKNFYYSEYFTNSYTKYLSDSEIKEFTNNKDISYEDACLFIYIKGLLQGFNYYGKIKQIVIDEAQDYNKLQYQVIKSIFPTAGFTILGDVNQTINPYYKYESLKELEEIFDEDTKFLELTKTYRSSKEIIEYTNKILGLNYVTAIRKENHLPVLIKEELNLKEDLNNDIAKLKENYKSIAIITKTDEEASKIYNLLKDTNSELSLLETNTEKFNRNLIVVPAYTAKGLEFDSVIIYTDKNNKYTKEEKYLYYVACTRCQHQLIIYNQN
mgnify:FL=1